MIARKAMLLFAFVLLTGCSGEARFVSTDPEKGIGVVAVPTSSICQWYYRHEALKYIRKYQIENFDEKDIITEGAVVVDPESVQSGGRNNRTQGVMKNADIANSAQSRGVPFADSMGGQGKGNTDKKEYQITYRLPPKKIVTVSSAVSQGGIAKPLPTGGVAGGVAFTTGYPQANGQPVAHVNGGAPMGAYPNPYPAQPNGLATAPMNNGVPPGNYQMPAYSVQQTGMPSPGVPNGYQVPNYPTQPIGMPNPGVPNGYQVPNYPAQPTGMPNPGVPNGYQVPNYPAQPTGMPNPGTPGGWQAPNYPAQPSANAAPGIVYPPYPAPVGPPAPGMLPPAGYVR
jgi:hypothetical protein